MWTAPLRSSRAFTDAEGFCGEGPEGNSQSRRKTEHPGEERFLGSRLDVKGKLRAGNRTGSGKRTDGVDRLNPQHGDAATVR
jgi:hypothetical protein